MTHPFEPRINLAACAIIEDDKLLLIYKKKQCYWEFPGGKVKSESLQEAAVRETQEEIGIEVIVTRHWGHVDFEVGDEPYRCHKYLASIPDGQTPEVKELKNFWPQILWMPVKNWESYPLAPNAKEFCKKYLKENSKK